MIKVIPTTKFQPTRAALKSKEPFLVYQIKDGKLIIQELQECLEDIRNGKGQIDVRGGDVSVKKPQVFYR